MPSGTVSDCPGHRFFGVLRFDNLAHVVAAAERSTDFLYTRYGQRRLLQSNIELMYLDWDVIT
jgi:hypothetical protein